MAGAPLFASSDARTLDRIRKGDEGALVELYRDNRAPVRALITRNSGTEADADDMLQEALVTLWERVRTGRFRYQARLGTFIYATARNTWLRRLARARRETTWTAADPPSDDASPLELMVEEEEADIVRSALERLGEPCRKLLLLFYWEEESMESIAAQTGMANADTVKSKKYQCKKALEALIRERMPRHG
ncbi:MAG TPA: sigma-70 family RNA polymerase sigma factor [Bacteroidota bacterium]|nr:sigma-70 family RNA polymerase sigma factor [Bacteroidota bacterium]